ncbi:MAG TPA: hypothetical protein VGB64_06020 [Actinomycetota bacterium]
MNPDRPGPKAGPYDRRVVGLLAALIAVALTTAVVALPRVEEKGKPPSAVPTPTGPPTFDPTPTLTPTPAPATESPSPTATATASPTQTPTPMPSPTRAPAPSPSPSPLPPSGE